MQTPEVIDFDRLGDRLLRGGVAPRHVRRTLTELRDHYDDALIAEVGKGLDEEAAAQAAWQRLGNEESIAANILARQELRSLPARFPRLIFGAEPVMIWFGGTVLTFVAIATILVSLKDLSLITPNPSGRDPDWFRALFSSMAFFYFRILPLGISLGMLIMAARQRLPFHWPVTGAVWVAVMSGTTDFAIRYTEHVGERGEFEFSNNLLPMFTESLMPALGTFQPETLMHGLSITALNLILIFGSYRLWRRRERLA